MKRLFFSLLMLVCAFCAHAIGFQGSTLENGKSYYLFNLYQQKFIKDAANGTATLGTKEDTPLLCTISNGKWQNYTLTAVEEGYNLKTNDGRALMFDAGTNCAVASLSEGFNADMAIWKLISQDEYNAYKAKKRFSVAALNVDGMPVSVKILGVIDLKLNSDGKEAEGAIAIGKKLKTMDWDVIGVSEDFNFHSQIWNEAWNGGTNNEEGKSYNATTHRGGIEVKTETYGKYLSSSTLFNTDGLCLFYKRINVDKDLLESSESWVAWNKHYGYTDNGADGLIDKGYRYYTVKLADGTEFDLYILHMDAETSAEDNAARESQIIQLATAIKSTNNKRPIIVMGDTNCRYTRDNLKTKFINALNADPRFTVKDTWIEFGRNGVYPTWDGTNDHSIMVGNEGYRKGEVVDKIFYINNTESDIRIEPETYCQDLSFINEAGEPLADHWPAVAEFSYHTYDPTIDDVADGVEGTYYLRNVETGLFLKAGGWWGTHAVAGDYGTAMTVSLANGKYTLLSSFGNLYIAEGQPYMDGAKEEEWTAIQKGNYMIFNSEKGALTVSGTDCNYGPNKKLVELSTLNTEDKSQQWELLTADDLRREMLQATSAKPFNCTHLLKGANFDRNDGSISAWSTDISNDAGRMSYNNAEGKNDSEQGNSCAKVYVSSWNKISSSPVTKWKVYQDLAGLPNGTYRISCQAFQYISNGYSTDAEIYLNANGEKSKVPLMSSVQITESGLGTNKQGNVYYPNNEQEASKYFNKGYYKLSVNVEVINGELNIKLEKTSDTGKSNTAWTCFDNFQIEFLAPAYGYTTETCVEEDDVLSLTGSWSSNEQGELDNILKDKKYHTIKLTDATVTGALNITGQNANTIIYANNASNVSNTQNVVINGSCNDFVLTDKSDFAAPTNFTASKVTYSRSNTLNYNTVCMPFSYEASDLGTVYELTNIESDESHTNLIFTEKDGTIEAGVPVLVNSTEKLWELSLANKKVVGTPLTASAQDGTQLHGAFIKGTIGAGYYKLSSDGTKFTNTIAASTVTPFRFYVSSGGNNSKEMGLRIGDDKETSLEDILQHPEAKISETYDLQGRKVLQVKYPGIYIKNGKKVMKR